MWWKNLKQDQKWNRWVNSWYKKWGDTERNEGWKWRKMNDLWHFLRERRTLKIVEYNSRCHLLLLLITPLLSTTSFPPPLLISAIPSPHPLSCVLLPSPQFFPKLSISHMFSWGSTRALTVQQCSQLVCTRGDLHGCSSQADFVLNLSPKCTQKTIVRLKGVESITGRERERGADFQVISRFHKATFKELFNATWKCIQDQFNN